MKKIILSLLLVALVIGGGFAYKTFSGKSPSGSASTAKSGSYTFAKAEPLTIPAVGG